jgi:serine/threonine protein phosphatase PrpC
MWRAVGTSVRGTSHIKFDLPCQDYSAYERVIIGSSPALVIAIADGAGTARLSQVGARAAVEHLLRLIPSDLRSILDANHNSACDWLADTRHCLEDIALQEHCELRDLGCTILFAILGEFASFFGQIGDGAWVVERDGDYFAATWPSDGEYINETTFLTSPNWADSVKCEMVDAISAAAGFTDGLQHLALQFDSQSVYVPFFDPLFRVLRAADDESSLISPLIEFLASDRLAERTDDDKTLVLACRTEPLLLEC